MGPGPTAAVLAALLLLPAGVGAEGAPESLGCGEFSPFANGCTDCCQPWRGSGLVNVTTLGFVGGLTLTLQGPEGSVQWACASLAANPVCGAGRAEGRLRLGDPLALDCEAQPLPAEAGLALGPLGPWGCSVDL